jgi:hypothetical protein
VRPQEPTFKIRRTNGDGIGEIGVAQPRRDFHFDAAELCLDDTYFCTVLKEWVILVPERETRGVRGEPQLRFDFAHKCWLTFHLW